MYLIHENFDFMYSTGQNPLTTSLLSITHRHIALDDSIPWSPSRCCTRNAPPRYISVNPAAARLRPIPHKKTKIPIVKSRCVRRNRPNKMPIHHTQNKSDTSICELQWCAMVQGIYLEGYIDERWAHQVAHAPIESVDSTICLGLVNPIQRFGKDSTEFLRCKCGVGCAFEDR